LRESYTEQEPGAVTPEEIRESSLWTPARVSAVSRNVFFVIAGCVIVGLFVTTSNLYYVAAAVGILILGVVLAWHFEAVMVVYAMVAFVPWGRTPDLAVGGSGMGKGLYVSQAMLGFLVVIWLIKYVFGSLAKDRIRTGFYVPLGLYLAYSVFNVLTSYLFWDYHVDIRNQSLAVNVIDLALRFLSAGALVLVATTISSRGWLKAVTWALLIAGLYNTVNGALGFVPFEAPWWPLLAILPAAYFCGLALDRGYPIWQRAFGIAIVGVAIYTVFYGNISWVSGWMGLFAALFTVLMVRNRKAAFVAVLVTAIMLIAFWPFVQKNVIENSRSEGDFDRLALLEGSWKYATTFPLGIGIGNYRAYNSFYYGEKWGTTQYGSAHGTYAQALAETGLPGLVLFLAVLACGFRWMLASYKRVEGASRVYLAAALGQMVGIGTAAVVGDYIVPTYHNGGLVMFSTTIYTWLIWGLAVAHVRISGDQVSGSVDSNS